MVKKKLFKLQASPVEGQSLPQKDEKKKELGKEYKKIRKALRGTILIWLG